MYTLDYSRKQLIDGSLKSCPFLENTNGAAMADGI
jgi:hypothetical protein